MITVLRGLPGSGKSPWATEQVRRNPESLVSVSRDDIRTMLTKNDAKRVLGREDEELVSAIEEKAIVSAVGLGKDVIVDAMHIRNKYCVKWLKLGESLGVDVSFKYFDVDVEECVKRDALRGENGAGEDAIRGIAGKFLKKGKIPLVIRRPEESVTPTTYAPSGDLPEAILVDIDGTVALNTGGRGWFDWARVGEDSPNEAVCRVVQTLLYDGGPEIVFVSGRSDECLTETLEWLDNNFDFENQVINLFMRKSEDFRKDSVVKSEIFWNDIAPEWDVLACIDDRQQVVDEYRAMGLTVFQVAEGNF